MTKLEDIDFDELKSKWDEYKKNKPKVDAEHKADMSKHKVKYFFFSILFTALSFVFWSVSFFGRTAFENAFNWIIAMVVSSIFLLVGVYCVLAYGWMIIRRK